MRWPQVGRIIRREYVESVRKKSFLFGLVATPAIMLGMIFLPLLSGGLLGADHIARQAVFGHADGQHAGEHGLHVVARCVEP